MREILFRGKERYKGYWVYGGYLPVNRMICTEKIITGTETIEDIFIQEETIGQYTGLTDKNGTMIFEGDIVKCRAGALYIVKIGEFYPKHLYKLCSATGEICVSSKYIGLIYGVYAEGIVKGYKGEHFIIPKKNAVEVIGNIHDNPELLKGGVE